MFQKIINRINPINENVSSETSSYKNMDEDNEKINWKDTIEFVAPIEKGIVIKVYDGDTITIASKLPYETSPLYRFSVRLNGIDCPEIKSKDENEKECAKIAKKEMNDLIMNKMVILKNVQNVLKILKPTNFLKSRFYKKGKT